MVDTLHSIILKTVKYGDSQLIVDVLTRERGRMSVVWHMPRNGKGKSARNIFQPLTMCSLSVERRRQSQLPVVAEAHISLPYSTLATDHVKVSVAFFIAEFLCQASRAEQADVPFYEFVEYTLTWYEMCDAMAANFHLMFLVRASRFLGFYPNMESYVKGSIFDLRTAEFSTSLPPHADYVPAGEADRLQSLMRMNPANMHLFRLTRDQRNHIVELMLRFYSLHIPDFKPMRSWTVLKEIFN